MGIGKKIKLYMNVLMGITLGGVLSLVWLISLGKITVGKWLIFFIISLILNFIISAIVPLKKITDTINLKYSLSEGKVITKVIDTLISDIVYATILSFAIVTVSTTMACQTINRQIDQMHIDKENIIAEKVLKETEVEDLENKIAGNEETIENLVIKKSEIENTIAKVKKGEDTGNINALEGQLLLLEDSIQELTMTNEGMFLGIEGTNQAIVGIQEDIDEIDCGIQNMEESKPHIIPSFLKGLPISLILTFVLIYIFQPLYLKLVFKKLKIVD